MKRILLILAALKRRMVQLLIKPTSLRVKPRPPVRSAYFLSSVARFSFSLKRAEKETKEIKNNVQPKFYSHGGYFCHSYTSARMVTCICKHGYPCTLCSIASRVLLSFKKLSFSRWACWVICAACFFRVNSRSWRKSNICLLRGSS